MLAVLAKQKHGSGAGPLITLGLVDKMPHIHLMSIELWSAFNDTPMGKSFNNPRGSIIRGGGYILI